MTTVLQARPRNFVSTPAIERVAARSLRYLQSGYSVHLRGPAGTGKTTLGLHLADMLGRPIMLLFGDDEFKTSDLIGNQTGYTRKKVVDNFIHSVVKVEDELRQNWVDSRLTLACREGFTLVYDEFNRSRPEVNNVLLAALEEKLLVLPPSNNRPEYIRVSPHFRAIFTSNPEEYCGVHGTQDALLDRLITINMPEPDELTQQEIAVQKSGIDRESASIIVQLVKAFRDRVGADKASGLRACLMIARICHEHEIVVTPENVEFRDICQDVLLSRSELSQQDSTRLLWDVFNELICAEVRESDVAIALNVPDLEILDLDSSITPNGVVEDSLAETVRALQGDEPVAGTEEPSVEVSDVPHEQEVYRYLQDHPRARTSAIQATLRLSRVQVIDAIQSLSQKGLLPIQGETDTAQSISEEG
ncbi:MULTISPECIES: gas vesicle protein GvpN [unclassified Leptolyngbya]|uniref:gas vesicle protein GvpN n=1 Tax=unclassified Leptolyngbya TaxID=2650499 RepID=UPI001689696F|nr:gas vesicle protein GvpN [Leptolyngbya sp. FACHB-8]MBD2157711.1 gas vesicle protein GvpN [Leptolyngbya sp. FACHB-16]